MSVLLAIYFFGSLSSAIVCVAQMPAAPNTIVEGYGWRDQGFGWKNLRIGMSREELIKVMGAADKDSSSDWFKWSKRHIECTFHTGSEGVSEIRFNPGFDGALTNRIKVGSSDRVVTTFYGQPEYVKVRPSGAKHLEYSTKGVLFWTYNGKITQIIVFKPYRHR